MQPAGRERPGEGCLASAQPLDRRPGNFRGAKRKAVSGVRHRPPPFLGPQLGAGGNACPLRLGVTKPQLRVFNLDARRYRPQLSSTVLVVTRSKLISHEQSQTRLYPVPPLPPADAAGSHHSAARWPVGDIRFLLSTVSTRRNKNDGPSGVRSETGRSRR